MQELLTVLDTKYKRLEYIQSTGTQYIDTGIKAQEGIEFICEVAFTDLTSGRFGSGTSSGYRYYFGVGNSYFIGANSKAYNHAIISADTNKHTFKLNDNGLYIDNNEVYSSVASYPSETQAINIFLFKSNTTVDFSAKCKNYSSIIKINGVLVRNFIPVLRKSDNELGMLDLVEGKFYPNAGTGKFTANLDTMYALIQGSPTVQDGRVSGFSSSNYLKVNDTITNISRTEIILDYIIGANLNNTGMSVFSSTQWGVQLYKPTNDDTKYKLNLGGSNLIGTKEFSVNEHIRIKLLVENDYLYISYYDFENSNWVLDVTYNPTEYFWSQKDKTQLSSIIFGDNQDHKGTRVFAGSMNLSASSIKIDDTKYKLQAVVGYTQPSGSSVTITNGIASGFSASDYLRLNLGTSFQNLQSFEFYMDFITGNDFSSVAQVLFTEQTERNTRIWKTASGTNLEFRYRDSLTSSNKSLIPEYTIQTNTRYKYKVSYVNGTITAKLYNADNNVLATDTNTEINPTFSGSYISFGSITTNNGIWGGSINLNNTYIKINNKLWFNGQPA